MALLNRHALVVSVALGLGCALFSSPARSAFVVGQVEEAGPSPEFVQPHVIFVLCDDLGFGDLGVLFQNDREESRRLHTPNIDALASEGALLTRHYCPAPVCAPSRASLMLGKHQGHAGVRNNQFDKALPRDHNLATVLKGAGYRTALIGKWGLQGKGKSPATWPAYPTKVGFDEFFGYVRHRDGHTHYPAHKTEARGPVELYDGDEEVSASMTGCYTTDLFTARAKKLLVDHQKAAPKTPLFLLLAYDTPHAALHVPTSAYPEGGGVEGGLQWTGEAGRMISTAVEPIDSWIHPDYATQEWTNSEKRFGTMVRRLDDCLGDLMTTLDDLGMAENTLLVLTSDNGPHKEAYTPGRRYGADRFDSFGPLDGIKRDVYEGGIRVPTVVRWPGVAPAGSRLNAASQFHDWMPTFAEAAGVPCPPGADGTSLKGHLKAPRGAPDTVVYVEYSGGGKTPNYQEFEESRRGEKRGEMQAIFLGGYMGVRTNILGHSDPFQIYDTELDPGQTRNLADTTDDFRALGESMAREVLRIRRPSAAAKRPYDSEPIPALFPPATDPSDLPAPSMPKSRSGDDWAHTVRYLDVPVAGSWTLTVDWQRGSVLRLHGATVIDNDFELGGGVVSGTAMLGAGLHPLHLFHQRVEGEGELILRWEGPDHPAQAIPEDRLHGSVTPGPGARDSSRQDK